MGEIRDTLSYLNATIFRIQARVDAIPVTNVATTQKAREVGSSVLFIRNAVPKITMHIKELHQGIKIGTTPDC